MGLFGPSKQELMDELEEVKASRDKIVNDLADWRKNTLDPHLAKLKSSIAEKDRILKEFGALGHEERLKRLSSVKSEIARLEGEITERRSVIATEEAQAKQRLEEERILGISRIEVEIKEARAKGIASARKATEDLQSKRAELKKIKASIIDLKDTAGLQDLGFFDYDNPAKSSIQLGAELETVRSGIKAMLKNGSAAAVVEGFTFNDSLSKGKRFANDMKKLMIRAYNAEAENAIKAVKFGNIETAARRLEKTRNDAQSLGQFIELTISPEFHSLRLREIELAHEHLKAVREEKERERERKARLREDAKIEAEIRREREARDAERKRAQRELEEFKRLLEQKRRESLEKERDHYENVASSEMVKADEMTLKGIQEKLEDAERAIADLDYREANIKAGYVYVLSNIGAFGESVVKIGMTRRLDPEDRVKELSGASVPFIFDTHLMVFSDDARGLEHRLHKHFDERRVNRINLRKEYFHATPQDVLEVLKEMDVAVVEFTRDAEAADYRAGLALTD